MTVFIDNTFAEVWRGEPFARALRQQGEVFREKEGRRTLRFSAGGNSYFLKLHQGVGWMEIIKNLAQWRLPVVSARNEWRAINKLREMNLHAPSVVAYGNRGLNPARRLSFLVTEELTGSISLEELCARWRERPPDATAKRALIAQVANLTRAMHAGGVNHRDFYLCHLRIDSSAAAADDLAAGDARLTVLDLHRAQIRRKTPSRWAVKDLGGLYFSARDIGLTARDVLRFMKTYRRKTVRELTDESAFWTRVARKAKRIHHGDFGRAPALPLG